MSIRRLFLAAAMAIVLLPAAQALDKPTGKVVLTINGKVSKTNASARAEFDMAMLEALPQHSFTTLTPWYKEPRKFTGPLLRDVLAAAGASGKMITAIALNDYKAEVPIDDTQRYEVVLARLMDDKPMPVRDKGPLFIIYPFDTDQTLRSERYYNRAAWQLKTLLIE
jgi:hypothetical protein